MTRASLLERESTALSGAVERSTRQRSLGFIRGRQEKEDLRGAARNTDLAVSNS